MVDHKLSPSEYQLGMSVCPTGDGEWKGISFRDLLGPQAEVLSLRFAYQWEINAKYNKFIAGSCIVRFRKNNKV